MSHVLVVANETVTGPSLIDAVEAKKPDLVTVVAPVSHPHEGYVVYEDTRRAAAGRRLERRSRSSATRVSAHTGSSSSRIRRTRCATRSRCSTRSRPR